MLAVEKSLIEFLIALDSQSACVRASVAAVCVKTGAHYTSTLVQDAIEAAREVNDSYLVNLLEAIQQHLQGGKRKAKQPLTCPPEEVAPIVIG